MVLINPSIEPMGLRNLVGSIGKIEKAMGDGIKELFQKKLQLPKNLGVI